MTQLAQRLGLDLADPLAGDIELLAASRAKRVPINSSTCRVISSWRSRRSNSMSFSNIFLVLRVAASIATKRLACSLAKDSAAMR